MVRVVVQIHLHPFIGYNVYRHIGSQNLNCQTAREIILMVPSTLHWAAAIHLHLFCVYNIRVCLLKQRSAGIYTIHLKITAKNTRFPMSHVKRGVVEVILWLKGNEKPKAWDKARLANGKRLKSNHTSVANPTHLILLLLLSLNKWAAQWCCWNKCWQRKSLE